MSIIFIILILIIIYIQPNRIEHFVDTIKYPSININSIAFGSLDLINYDFVKNYKVKLFPLPLPLQNIKKPYMNDDQLTTKELYLVLNTSKDINDKQKQSVIKYENSVPEVFINYCRLHKLIYNENYINQVVNDIKFLSYQLKMIYNRPRPYQLGYYLNIPIRPLSIIHSNTPSYPSYSTLLAKILAYCLSYNNPSNEKNLHNIAKEVELSRLLGGYNYPSDNEASLTIAEIVKKYIKYFENTN